MLNHLAHALYKRTTEGGFPLEDPNGVKLELPSWAFILILVDLIIAIPFFVILNYTISKLYPVFAMVENENPPAYEPLALSDDPAAEHPVRGSKPTHGENKTVTSSLRAINRLLRSTGGFKANFRGIFCAFAQVGLTWFLMGIFSAFFGGIFTPVATLLATLALVQYSAAWVHIVISLPSPLRFYQRLPPFKRTFEATWKAVTLNWFAVELTRWVPTVLAAVLGLDLPAFENGQPDVNGIGAAYIAKALSIGFVSVIFSIFFVVPSQVILVRIQSSLLPVEEDVIIPYDRTFEGKVEPAIVGGLGYATISDAWSTFTKAGWRRLLILYVKIFLVNIAANVVFIAVLLPQVFLIIKNSKQIENPN